MQKVKDWVLLTTISNLYKKFSTFTLIINFEYFIDLVV